MVSKIQLHLISFFFDGLLPPKENKHTNNNKSQQQSTYYSALDIASNATPEEIRKAYRKKSLFHHPDKVAQRRRLKERTRQNTDNVLSSQKDLFQEEDFVSIKEAYETLSDEARKNAYDVLGKEGGKMFCSITDSGQGSGQGSGPGFELNSLVYNLARASLFQKSKLFLLVFLVVMLILLTPIFICLKVDHVHVHVHSYSAWVAILTPLWIMNLLLTVQILLARRWFALARMGCIVALEVLLALKWDARNDESNSDGDGDGDGWPWRYDFILIPLFIHQSLVCLEGIWNVWRSTQDMTRMVTISYLEKHILPHLNSDGADGDEHGDHDGDVETPAAVPVPVPVEKRSYEDISDEEREALLKIYIIVTEINDSDDDDDDDDGSLDSREANLKFMYTLAHSPEYEQATLERSQGVRRMISVILFRIPFLILLALQLADVDADADADVDTDSSLRWNWNVVFVPIWVEILCYTLSSCYNACCAASPFRRRGPPASASGPFVDEDGDEMEIIEIVESESESGDGDGDDHNNEGGTRTGSGSGRDEGDVIAGIQEDLELGRQESEKLLQGHTVTSNQGATTTTPESANTHASGTKDLSAVAHKNEEVPDSDFSRIHKNNNDDADDDDEFEDIHIDSESAEQHVKALGGCCYYLMLVVTLTLFLVKLNRATGIQGGVNYSSFWVMFPLFAIATLILCLFGCCIFAAPDVKQDEGVHPPGEGADGDINLNAFQGEDANGSDNDDDDDDDDDDEQGRSTSASRNVRGGNSDNGEGAAITTLQETTPEGGGNSFDDLD